MEGGYKRTRKQKNYNDLEIKNIDIIASCRTCLNHSLKMYSLFTIEGRDLCEKMLSCIGLQVKECDGFPVNICGSCHKTLHLAHKFKTQCLAVDVLLKNHIGSSIKREPGSNIQAISNDSHVTQNDEYIMHHDEHTPEYDDPIDNDVNYFAYNTNGIKTEPLQCDKEHNMSSNVENVNYTKVFDEIVVKTEPEECNFNEIATESHDLINFKPKIELNEPVKEINDLKFTDNEIKPICSDNGIQQSSNWSQNNNIEIGHNKDQLNTKHTNTVIVNNKKKERQQRYREQNREKLRKREAERRKRIQFLQGIAGPSSISANINRIVINNEAVIDANSQSSSLLEGTQTYILRNKLIKEINALQRMKNTRATPEFVDIIIETSIDPGTSSTWPIIPVSIIDNKKSRGSRGPYRKRVRPITVPVDGSKPVKYRRLYCEPCDIRFSSREESLAHKRQVHQDAERWTCEYCGKEGNRRINYYAHRRRHEQKMDKEFQKFDHQNSKRNDEIPAISNVNDVISLRVPDNGSCIDQYDVFKDDGDPKKVPYDTKEDSVTLLSNNNCDPVKVIKKKQAYRKKGPYRKRIRPIAVLEDGSRVKKFRRLYCETCDLRFSSKEETQAHKSSMHQDAERWTCEYCGKKGDKRMGYYTHRRRHELKIDAEFQKSNQKNFVHSSIFQDDDDGYVDPFDVFFKNNVFPLKKSWPVARESGEAKNVCDPDEKYCNEDAVVRWNTDTGSERTRKKRPRLNQCFCEKCGIKFQNFDQFLEHKRDVHNFNYLCEICGKLLHNRNAQYSHSLIHRMPMLSCDMCDYKSARKTDLIKHINIHTGTRNFICDHCPASFSTISNLLKHCRVHDAHRPQYCCGRCGKEYTTKRSYDAHMMIHKGQSRQTRYMCKICGTSFYRHYRLSEHVRNTHGAPPPAPRRPGRRRLDPAPHLL